MQAIGQGHETKLIKRKLWFLSFSFCVHNLAQVLGNSNATFSNGERISSGSRLHSPSLTNIQHSLYFSSFLFHTFFYFRFSQCISLYFAHFFTWLIFSLPPSTSLPFFLTLSSTFYSVNVSLFYLFCVFVMGRCRSTVVVVVVVVAARHRFFANL